MMPSPVQLMRLNFNRVQVEIDAAHMPAELPNPLTTVFVFDGVSLSTEVGLGEIDMAHERGPLYLVSLRLRVDNQPSDAEPNRKFSPYRIDIEAAGVVLLPHGAEKLGPPTDLVTVNGAALLWSAIREQLLTLSSRMPAGPAMLPTVHFHDLKQAAPVPAGPDAEGAVTQAAAPAKKSRRSKPAPSSQA